MTGLSRVAESVEKEPAQSLSALVPQQWQDSPPYIANDMFAPSCWDCEQPEIAAAASQVPSHQVPPMVQQNQDGERPLLHAVERLLYWNFLDACQPYDLMPTLY